MQFIKADPGRAPKESEAGQDDASDDGVPKASGGVTMGFLVDSIYAGDWTAEVEDFLGGG
jgi:hypothetical protein